MRRFKPARLFAASAALSLSSLISIGFAPAVHAAGAPYTCTWTGAGSDTKFSTAANWSGCNSAAPQAGDADNLVFDNTALSADATPTNDITNLSVGNIAFSGSGNSKFTVSGTPISIAGGISHAGTVSAAVNTSLTLTADQTFDTVTIGDGTTASTLDLGSHQLSIKVVSIQELLAGTGAINLPASFSSSIQSPVGSPSYSGAITVNNNSVLTVNVDNGDPIGTAAVTVADGGSLSINATADTYTLANNISLAGDGGGAGALVSCLGLTQGCTNDGNDTALTLSGTLTLTADAKIANGAYYSSQAAVPANSATFTLTGTVADNGHVLSAMTDSNTKINGSAAGSFATVDSDDSASPAVAPTTPDTGFGLIASHPLVTLLATFITAGTIIALAQRSRKSTIRR